MPCLVSYLLVFLREIGSLDFLMKCLNFEILGID